MIAFLVLIVVIVLSVVVYWALLDRKIVDTFQTSRWSIPAKVYARPLELHEGAEINLSEFVKELSSLGYLQTQILDGTGQYLIDGPSVQLWHRGFSFWDVPELSQKIELKFSWNALRSVTAIDSGEIIPVMRMDPVLIGKIHPRRFEDRELLRYDELPKVFVDALIAVEDQKFFIHKGIDISAIARAAINNFQAKRFKQGASTLTQQLVKNFYLSPDRTLKRKITEIMMSISLEFRHTKEEILEAYINEVFLGQEGNRAIHGFGLASLFYFSKPLGELNTLEIATLVGMVKGPSVYNPKRNPVAAINRRNVVLDVMFSANLLTKNETMVLKESPLVTAKTNKVAKRKHSSFMDLVQQQLLRDYSYQHLNESGLNVFTTLDFQLQNHAETVIPLSLDKIEKDRGKKDLQVGVVIADPRSGEIAALIGDRYPNRNGFNRAVDALRPIGSVVKPFVYSYALARPTSYSLGTTLRDESIRWTDVRGVTWTPKNYDGNEYGDVTLLDALTRSLNLAAISLGFELGLPAVKDYLVSLGAPDNLASVPSILLGAVEMSPLSLAEMYTPLANQGFRTPLQAIKEVTTSDGKKLTRYEMEND
jgi:penicillin-binding protein 1B